MDEARIVKEPDGKLRLANFYTPVEEAKKEIWRRWNDKDLRKKVEKFLEKDVPEVFKGEPKAVLFRYIATPDFEHTRAKQVAEKLGMDLIYLEFVRDKFCTINPDKRGLGRLNFFHGRNINGECMITKKNIFDLAKNDGKPFNEIKTFWDEPLVDFHHRLFEPYFKKTEVYDVSQFAKRHGSKAINTYPYFLALFVCFGVLVETLSINYSKDEEEFARKIVIPALNKIRDEFGVKPLIVRHLNGTDDELEKDDLWVCYPEFIKTYIKNIQ